MHIKTFQKVHKVWPMFVVLLCTLDSYKPAQAQNLSVGEGGISIRALADRQRKVEQAEFLNRLNPNTFSLPTNSSPLVTGSDGAVQVLPPIKPDFSSSAPAPIAAIKEPAPPAVNTVMSVYGPESNLIVEVAKKGGLIERYRTGDDWNGHRIIAIAKEGVTVARAGKNRLVAVGSKL